MGIDLATWRARIGLNYYHMCWPLQTRWRSSGGQLYQPGVASWGVGEVMNDTPLVLKGCMTVVALSLILQYVVHSWSKLKGRGGGSKVHCHWRESTCRLRETLDGEGTLLLKAIVILLLLVIAGDVETNPGPEAPNLRVLLNELHPVYTSWFNIGLQLGIPYHKLECFKQMYLNPSELMREMLARWFMTAIDPRPSWEAVVAALRSPSVDAQHLAEQLESKYCTPIMHESNSPITSKTEKSKDTEGHTTSEAIHSANTSPPPSKGFEPVQKESQLDTDNKPDGGFTERGISSSSSFPHLNLSEFTHKQQHYRKERLRRQSEKINLEFQKLVSATIESLNRQNVSPDKLLSHVMTLGALKRVFEEPQVPALHHRFKELKAAKTIYESFLVLNDYFSFFNCHIIEHIIEELGTEEDKANLRKYKQYFHRYAERRIFECLPEFGRVLNDADHVDILVKLDSQYDDYTVTELERFCHKLSEILNISLGILCLCRVDKGCLQMIFQVPSFVQNKVFPLSRVQERALAAVSVISLTCGEYHLLINEPSQEGLERKHQHHPDDDSGVGPSISVDTKSSSFPEKLFDKELKELDYELQVQGLIETASSHKPGSGFELHVSAGGGQLEYVRFLVEKKHYNPMQRDQDGFAAFHVAAITGRLQVFEHFITECNCNPACPGPLGLTPLHLASEHGQLDVVKYLVTKQQMDPLCEDEYRNTPLHRACAGGCQAVVEFLTLDLKKYTPIPGLMNDLKNKWNRTPLHSAVANGHLGILQFFVSDQKCDPNIVGQDGRTPLHYAAEFGHLHIVKYLTDEQGCNPSCVNDYNYTPLHCAAMKGRMDIVKFLTVEKHCDPTCKDCDQNTPLHRAAMHGHKDIVKFLTIEMGCKPTNRDAYYNTALHLAAKGGYLDILHFFISDQNCEPSIRDKNGRTPLHWAAEFGHLNIIKYLIDEQGCNPSCLDEHESAPLHCAAMNGHTGIVKFFILEKHCKPTCRDHYQQTPLHIAAQNGHIDIVKFLTLEKHCDPTSRNGNNNTALHLAVAKGHLDIVNFFVSDQNFDPNISGCYGRTLLHTAAEFGQLHIVKYFTDEQSCSPSCLDEYKYTPLHCAAMKGHLDIVKFLTIEKHCNPMCKDYYQYTPLHRAAENGHEDVVKFLTLKMHCDPTSRNAYNNTALHLAVQHGHLDIVKIFIRDGNCDPNILGGKYDSTPLHIAAEYGHLDIVTHLTEMQGCNASCLDKHKHTPLHRAALRGRMDTVKFLTVEKHCDPVSHDIFGSTVLHLAVWSGNLEVVKFLIEELKCPPDLPGPNNMAPLRLAIFRNNQNIAQYLQKHSIINTAIAMMKQLGFL